jgi:epoxyqueuosine reductase QueG
MSDTSKIKDYILNECLMDIAGVAEAALLMDEPAGYRPTDILPGARSVVVYGKRMPDGGVQAAFRGFEDGNRIAKSGYGAFCADLASNFSLLFQTFQISQFIERHFQEVATPLPCGPMQCGVPVATPVPAFVEPFRVGLPLNIERAAVAAGLGEYGWSGRLLTPEFGPRIQFGAVITTMPLEFDAPYSGAELCGGEPCGVCVRQCPVDAIPGYEEGETRQLGVGEGKRAAAEIRLNRCIVAACALRREFGGLEDFVASKDPTEAELEDAFKKVPINHWEGLDHYPKWKCDKCLVYCPTGNWKERFLDRGLTKG